MLTPMNAKKSTYANASKLFTASKSEDSTEVDYTDLDDIKIKPLKYLRKQNSNRSIVLKFHETVKLPQENSVINLDRLSKKKSIFVPVESNESSSDEDMDELIGARNNLLNTVPKHKPTQRLKLNAPSQTKFNKATAHIEKSISFLFSPSETKSTKEKKNLFKDKKHQIEEESKLRLEEENKYQLEKERRFQLEENKGRLEEQENKRQLEEDYKRQLEEDYKRQLEEDYKRQLEESKRRLEEEYKRQLEEEYKRRLEEEYKRRLEEENKRRLEEENKRRLEEENKRRLEEENKRRLEEENKRRLEEENKRRLEEENKRRLEEDNNRRLQQENNRRLQQENNRRLQQENKRRLEEETKSRFGENKNNRQLVENNKSMKTNNKSLDEFNNTTFLENTRLSENQNKVSQSRLPPNQKAFEKPHIMHPALQSTMNNSSSSNNEDGHELKEFYNAIRRGGKSNIVEGIVSSDTSMSSEKVKDRRDNDLDQKTIIERTSLINQNDKFRTEIEQIFLTNVNLLEKQITFLEEENKIRLKDLEEKLQKSHTLQIEELTNEAAARENTLLTQIENLQNKLLDTERKLNDSIPINLYNEKFEKDLNKGRAIQILNDVLKYEKSKIETFQIFKLNKLEAKLKMVNIKYSGLNCIIKIISASIFRKMYSVLTNWRLLIESVHLQAKFSELDRTKAPLFLFIVVLVSAYKSLRTRRLCWVLNSFKSVRLNHILEGLKQEANVFKPKSYSSPLNAQSNKHHPLLNIPYIDQNAFSRHKYIESYRINNHSVDLEFLNKDYCAGVPLNKKKHSII